MKLGMQIINASPQFRTNSFVQFRTNSFIQFRTVWRTYRCLRTEWLREKIRPVPLSIRNVLSSEGDPASLEQILYYCIFRTLLKTLFCSDLATRRQISYLHYILTCTYALIRFWGIYTFAEQVSYVQIRTDGEILHLIWRRACTARRGAVSPITSRNLIKLQ